MPVLNPIAEILLRHGPTADALSGLIAGRRLEFQHRAVICVARRQIIPQVEQQGAAHFVLVDEAFCGCDRAVGDVSAEVSQRMGGVDATETAAAGLPFLQSDHLATFGQYDSRRLGGQHFAARFQRGVGDELDRFFGQRHCSVP
ncbi:hypothetical protein D9M73_199100 [compost metagenome]